MARLRGVNLRAALVALVLVALVAVSLVGLTRVVRPPAQDRRAAPGTAWLSGEARGRAVLAAPGSQLGSVAVALGSEPTQYDVAELPKVTTVFDRHSGALVLLDPVLGAIKDRQARAATRDQAKLVPAGAAAFIVDTANHSARKIAEDGTVGNPVDVGSFSDVVGSSDGVLWLLDKAAGTYTSFDGAQTPTPVRLTEAGADVSLTAVGRDPVVLDRTARTLRWPRRGSTVALPAGQGELAVQQPDLAGYSTCATVVVGTVARCYSVGTVAREATLGSPLGAASQVFSGLAGLVIAEPGLVGVQVGGWGRSLVEATRSEPSTRDMTSWSTPTAILVDDPGSRYAFTATGEVSIGLDKFSRKTVVLTPDGPQIDLDQANDVTVKAPTTVRKPKDPSAKPPDRTAGNHPPTPQRDDVRTRQDRAVSIDVLANDSDADGDPLVIVDATKAAPSGQVSVLNGTKLLFKPEPGFLGNVTFSYTVADPSGLRASADVSVEVLSKDVNTAPVLQDDDATTSQGVPVVIPVLENDADPEGDLLNVVAVGRPAHGTVASTNDGFVRYEPDRDYVGTDQFVYSAADGYGGRADATVHVEVSASQGGNRPPIAQDDRATVVAGKHVRVSVRLNDSDPDGDPIKVVFVGNVFGMTTAILGGETVDIVPDLRTAGVVTVPYTIADSNGAKATAQIILVVEAPTPNRAPHAIDDSAVAASDVQVIDVVANDIDPDGDQLTLVDVAQPVLGGSVSKASPATVRFVPTPGYIGAVKFTYTISDPDGLRSTGAVIIEVVPPTGSGPLARDDIANTFSGEPVIIPVLANDTHPDGVPFGLAGPPVIRSGTAVVNADGTITYTSAPGATGTFTMSYTIRDFYSRTATAQVIITVDARPTSGGGGAENHPPIASNDHAFTAFQTAVVIDVVANDSDPEYQKLVVSAVSAGTGGSVAIVTVPPAPNASTTRVSFTPSAGFSGLASFAYTIADEGGLTASATVVVDVGKRLLVAPVARDDLVNMAGGASLSFDPRSNDLDPDGQASALRVTGVSAGPGITATIDSNGFVHIVAPAITGTYDITYTVTDVDGLTASGNISVRVASGSNRAPTPVADTATANFQTPVTINVLANDTDPDGGALTLVSATQPATGGSTAVQGSAVVFTPAPAFSGPSTFSYTVADPQGATGTATVAVTVSACSATAPNLANDTVFAKFNTATPIDLFANDTQTAGALSLGAPNVGRVTLTTPGTGNVTYTPPTGFNGVATFTYTVTPPCGPPATATATITVNRAPSAVADAATTALNTAVVIAVLTNDTDPDGDAVHIAGLGTSANGTVEQVAGTQNVQFSPTVGFSGSATFTYQIADIGGLTSSPATVTVTVAAPANHRPNARADGAATASGTAVQIDVLNNDTDPDNDTLTITAFGLVNPAGAGSATRINTSTGEQVVFTPTGAFAGPATFTYTISDGHGGADTATVTVTVASGNRPPVAGKDAANVTPGGVTFVSALANDTDPDGDTLSIIAVGPVPRGAGTANLVGSTISFTADPDFTDSINFTYTISDGHNIDIGRVTMSAAPPNTFPTAEGDSANIIRSRSLVVSVPVVANDTDPDGDQLVIIGVSGCSVVEVCAVSFSLRVVTVAIVAPFTGTLTVQYTVSDGRGGSASANLTIDVTS